jgi:hypothetical protein
MGLSEGAVHGFQRAGSRCPTGQRGELGEHANVADLVRLLRILERGIGFQPVVFLWTGWKPIPLNYRMSRKIVLLINTRPICFSPVAKRFL